MAAVPLNSMTMLESVRKTCESLNVGPQHSAMVRAAEVVAFTVDQMDREERVRMIAQTVPVLLRVLEQLTVSAGVVGPEPRGLSDAALTLFLDEIGATGAPD